MKFVSWKAAPRRANSSRRSRRPEQGRDDPADRAGVALHVAVELARSVSGPGRSRRASSPYRCAARTAAGRGGGPASTSAATAGCDELPRARPSSQLGPARRRARRGASRIGRTVRPVGDLVGASGRSRTGRGPRAARRAGSRPWPRSRSGRGGAASGCSAGTQPKRPPVPHVHVASYGSRRAVGPTTFSDRPRPDRGSRARAASARRPSPRRSHSRPRARAQDDRAGRGLGGPARACGRCSAIRRRDRPASRNRSHRDSGRRPPTPSARSAEWGRASTCARARSWRWPSAFAGVRGVRRGGPRLHVSS